MNAQHFPVRYSSPSQGLWDILGLEIALRAKTFQIEPHTETLYLNLKHHTLNPASGVEAN